MKGEKKNKKQQQKALTYLNMRSRPHPTQKLSRQFIYPVNTQMPGRDEDGVLITGIILWGGSFIR